jgi:hypothetical protein
MMAEDMVEDNNNITKMILINFSIRIIKLIIIILNISYFLGMFWLIFTDLGLELSNYWVRLEAEGEHHQSHTRRFL